MLSCGDTPASICASRSVSQATVLAGSCPLKIRSKATIASSGVAPVPTSAWSSSLPATAAQPPALRRKSAGLYRKWGVLISSVAVVCARRSCRLCRWRARTPCEIDSCPVVSHRLASPMIASSREQTLLKVTSAASRAPPSTARAVPSSPIGAPESMLWSIPATSSNV